MTIAAPSQLTSRRFFIGCSATALPLLTFGKKGKQSNELELRLSQWLKHSADSFRLDGFRQGVPVYRVELNPSKRNGFYESLAKNFPDPRIGKNNLVELRSETQSVQFRLV